ncbi:LlaJI family restriction endonuclease [Lebetimonas sp. JH369]|uniref:LlaJI family restriction endonuclease n=1 Tax=Lebetimonas sp. JH369 TaxID=990069 RepID=UPI000467C75E|nr:LlaJI family restriction endonuclease [Lebetimonas sp. JH369]
MKKLIILYENQSLTNDEIKNVPEELYYNQKVIKVGYFYESRSDKHFFILPKLLDGILIEEKELYNFIILFFKSLKRINNEENKCNFSFIESNLKEKEFTHLEAIISLIDFYKKNKETLFSYAQQILLEHQSSSKTNWNKTILKTIPFISNKKPIYISFVNNKKIIDKDEKLLKIFYSTIYYLNKEYFINLTIPDIIKDFFVYSPKEFKRIKKKIIKSIKVNKI